MKVVWLSGLVHFQHGDVQFRVHAYQMYGDAPSVAQGDPQGMFVLDDMVGGDDVPFLGDDDSGTQAVHRQPFFNDGLAVFRRLGDIGYARGVYADQHPLHELRHF